ncbi:MAG: type VI secretion system baseplate subunit TssG [Rhodobacteraceae bacterium]|nr:type VI secretion system baseplate subunit TssG [Paracoccaceae bacterium]
MASDERKKTGDLSRFEAFKEHPEKYHIFQALRLIEAAYADTPRLGRSRRPKQDAVRLKQRIDMSFASSTVARFVPQDEQTGEPGELAQYMFGLFGPNGPLPLHLTEYAYNRQHSFRDATFKAFGDMFHHRMLSLFYRAYASGEPTSSFDRKGEVDPFAEKVAAFAGLRGAAMRGRDAMPDLAKLRYAGRLAHGTRNEEGLLALISGFFGAPATMESFVGTWLELDKKDTWELGNPHKPAKLGQSCSIGSKVWTRQAKFRFRVGPVGLADYKRLLPGGESLQRLKALVNNYMGEAMMWDMNLVLRKGEAEPAMLARAVIDEEVSVVLSHQEEIVTKVERAEDVPFTPVVMAGEVALDGLEQATPEVTMPDESAAEKIPKGGEPEDVWAASEDAKLKAAQPEASDIKDAAPEAGQGEMPEPEAAAPIGKNLQDEMPELDEAPMPLPVEPPLDMDKTVVLPLAVPSAASVVASEIEFGEVAEPFEESPQIPSLSAENGHEDDTRPEPRGVYLGWTAWLGAPPDDKDLDQLYIQSDAQPGE